MLLPIQEASRKYVTVEQARRAFGLSSKGATQARLKHLVSIGQAEIIMVGDLQHYHIKANEELR